MKTSPAILLAILVCIAGPAARSDSWGPYTYTVASTTNIPVAVDARTNLLTGAWERLLTTNIPPAAAFTFEDPDAAAHPTRFYRVVAP